MADVPKLRDYFQISRFDGAYAFRADTALETVDAYHQRVVQTGAAVTSMEGGQVHAQSRLPGHHIEYAATECAAGTKLRTLRLRVFAPAECPAPLSGRGIADSTLKGSLSG